MVSTLVFIDDGFLSKLSKYFGDGKYLKFHRLDFAKKICKKEGLFCEKIFVYTAPPFQSDKPTKTEVERKEGYDKFVTSLNKEGIVVREGRCQRLKIDGDYIYSQKGVDILLAIDLLNISRDYPEVKKIILIASDRDFVPVISDLEKRDIKIILYTYFEKGRKAAFSTSNHLIKSVFRYVNLTKFDFKFEK